ncbi:MAG: WG repeat-containing protein [Muribaculaceae bacterium]|nr:WG repeat-containing protein [Muribaculaceae bacterium]
MRKFSITFMLLCISTSAIHAQHSSDYRMVFPEPIDNPDPETEKVLGYKSKGYYNLTADKGEFVLTIGYQFQEAYPFNPKYELARVKQGDKYGFIRIDGLPAILCTYDDARDIDENGFAMVNQNGKWGLLTFSNISAIPCVYDTMDDLYNGWYEVSRDGEWGYIHNTGVYASSYSEYAKKKETIGTEIQ